MNHFLAMNPQRGGNKGSASCLPLAEYDKLIAQPWLHDMVEQIRGGNDKLKGLPPEIEMARLGRESGKIALKQKGKTAIPEGSYPVAVTWSPRFKRWLPLLLGVPKFEGIRIHAGNTAEDTQGCILVGENKKVGMVVNSRIWLTII